MTALRPVKKHHTSTTGANKITMGGITNPAPKEVTIITIQISIQPSLKDIVLGQAKINENITKKLMFNDKMIENINSKIESLSYSVKNQLSFDKMIENQIAHVNNTGKSWGNPRIPPSLFMQLQNNKGGEVLPTDYKCRALAKR